MRPDLSTANISFKEHASTRQREHERASVQLERRLGVGVRHQHRPQEKGCAATHVARGRRDADSGVERARWEELDSVNVLSAPTRPRTVRLYYIGTSSQRFASQTAQH